MTLSNSWQIRTVGHLFEVQLGKMLNKLAKEKHPQYPYLGNSDVRWGYFNLSDLKTMHFNEREMGKFTLENGDILMCEGGEVGRCAIWNGGENQIYYQKALHRLRGKGDIVPEYFQSFMSFINGTKLLDDFSTKTSITHLTREKLLELPVKTPPLPEQRKIAKILSTWDKAITTTEKLIEASKQQKKALMQQLLTGKKRLVNPDTGKAFDGEWEEKLFKHILKLDRGSSPRPIINFMTSADDGVNWIKIGDTKKGELYINSTKEKITLEGANKSRKVSKGEVIVSNSMSYGQPYILNIDGYIHDGWFVIRNYEEHFEKNFLLQILGSELIQQQYKRLAAGGVVSNISSDLVYAVRALLPPLIEQQKIALILSAADKEIELFEAKLAHFKQEKKALMQQLLTGKRRVSLSS